jgi:hypothetical protein
MIRAFLIVGVATCLASSAYAQNVTGRFSSSVYSFERVEGENASNTHLRAGERLNLNVAHGSFAIRTNMIYEMFMTKEVEDDPRFRCYHLYAEGRDLFDMATVKVGRLPLYNNLAGGLYDGASVKLSYGDWIASGFYGGNVPAYQKLEIAEDWADNNVAGGEIKTTAIPDAHLSLAYYQKYYKPESYTATRLDADLNPVEYLIEANSLRYRYAGMKASYKFDDVAKLRARYDFDLTHFVSSRIEATASYTDVEDLGVHLYYNYRAPRVRYNSIFSVFDYGNTHELELGTDYKITPSVSAIAKFGMTQYKDDDATRATVGARTDYGTITYRTSFGAAGEQNSVSVFSARTFMEGLLTPSIGAAYTSYKLSEDSPENTILSALVGCNVRPWRTLSLDVQGQYHDNKITQNDMRLLVKLNYWFNANLGVL